MAERIDYVFNLDISQFEKSIQQARTLVENFKREFQNSLSGVGQQTDAVSKNVNKINAGFTSMRKITRSIVGLKLGQKLSSAIANSVSFTERLNLFNVSMGDSRKEMTRWTNQMAEAFGLDPSNLMRTSGMFRLIAKSMSLTAEQADIVSRNFTKAAIDIASLYELDTNVAVEKLESGLVGLGKPLRDIGIVIDENALQLTAYSLGLTNSVRSMSEASKVGLRYITVMRSMRSAMGDFAKTIESPANQLRVLNEQVQRLSRAIGNLFIGVIAKVLPYINGFIMALRTLIELLGKFLGLTGVKMENSFGAVEDSAWGVGDAISDAAKKAKMLVAPFDELNILNEDAGSASGGIGGLGGIDPAILAAMQEYDNLMDQVQMKANKVRDYIMETLGFTKSINAETGEIEWTWSFEGLINGMKRAITDLIAWWNSLNLGQKLATVFVAGWAIFLIGKGLKLMLKPFSLFASGALGLIGEVLKRITNSKTLGAAFSVLEKHGLSAAQALGGAVASVFLHPIQTFQNVVSVVGGWITGWASKVSGVFGSVVGVIKGLFTGLASFFGGIFSKIFGFIAALPTKFIPMLSTLGGMITNFAGVVANAILHPIASIQAIGSMVANLGSAVVAFFTGPLGIVALIALAVAALIYLWTQCEWFREGVTNAMKAIGAQLQSIYKRFSNIIKTSGDILKKLLQLVMKIFTAIFQFITLVLKTLWEGPIGIFLRSLIEGFGTAILWVLKYFEGFLMFIDGVLAFLNGDWSEGLSKMLSGVTVMFESAFAIVYNIVAGIWNGIVEIIEWGINKCVDAINVLIRAYNSVASKLGLPTLSELSHVTLERANFVKPEFETNVENANTGNDTSWQSQADWDDQNLGTGEAHKQMGPGQDIFSSLGLDNLFGNNSFNMEMPEFTMPEMNFDMAEFEINDEEFDFGDMGNFDLKNMGTGTSTGASLGTGVQLPAQSAGLQPGDKIVVQIGSNEWDAEILKSVRRAEAASGYSTVSGGTFNG